MCQWGTLTTVKLCKPQKNSIGALFDTVTVDSCIAPIIQALNNAGIETIASCCGHKRRIGNIVLGDNRELFIIPDFETGRKIDELIDIDIHG